MRRTGRNGAAVVLAASLAAEASAIAIVSFLTSDEERKNERKMEVGSYASPSSSKRER